MANVPLGVSGAAFDMFTMTDGEINALGDPGLITLLQAFKEWQPRQFTTEAGYAMDLESFLRRHFFTSTVETQARLSNADSGLKGKIDLVLADSVAIEIKRRINDSVADRAIGQMRKYATMWRKGPLVLLVAETVGNAAERRVAKEVASIRSISGSPVMYVAAGRRPDQGNCRR